ncbi:MAG TPA: lipoyl synthase, partial [Vicinamibacteria bacterium]
GGYRRSLELLRRAKALRPAQVTKSGFMVGLGEDDGEVEAVLRDLRAAAVDIVTMGQYLRPTREHLPVARYLAPEGFTRLERLAAEMGFPTVYAGVFVRSSFNAEEVAGPPAAGAGPPHR